MSQKLPIFYTNFGPKKVYFGAIFGEFSIFGAKFFIHFFSRPKRPGIQFFELIELVDINVSQMALVSKVAKIDTNGCFD